MASVKVGLHSIASLLEAAGVNFEEVAAADYNDGAPDYRKVKVGGLGFDNLEKQIRVPEAAENVEITVDDKVVATLDVDSDEE